MNSDDTLGLDNRLRAKTSLGSRLRTDRAGNSDSYQTAMVQDVNHERTPYLNPTNVFKGQLIAPNGTFAITDATGTLTYLGVDPSTGVLTINLPVLINDGFTTLGFSVFGSPIVATAGGTIVNSQLAFAGGTTEGTAAIRMYNSGGTERITFGIS